MSPLVVPGMVSSHELSAALVTFMWSVFGVYPSMSSKFIRSEEGPSTGFPHAFTGPFTCVFALVIHEVGALSISFSHSCSGKALKLGMSSWEPFPGPRNTALLSVEQVKTI